MCEHYDYPRHHQTMMVEGLRMEWREGKREAMQVA